VLAVVGLAALLLAGLAACSDDDTGGDEAEGTAFDVEGAEAAEFEVQPSTEAITVVDGEPGTEMAVVDAEGHAVTALFSPDGHRAETGEVDDDGNLIFSRVPPGDGYQVVEVDGDEAVAASDEVRVGGVYDQPEQSLYDDQELVEGLNYLEMRDGTTLSAYVTFPASPLPDMPDGVYPTVIDYSGYDTSNPAGSGRSIAQFAALYGYATVGVNARGSGCSGGVFSFFEPDQVADGYDLVEAIAAQDWVLDHEPGLIGISYAGNSQLYAASTQPPSLAAIAPMSVLDTVYDSVLYPGGIYNDGFAESWATNVGEAAEPYGQGWEQAVVDEGGEVGEQCEANQALRSQNPQLADLAQAYPYYDPDLADPLTATEIAERIEVPVFLTGAWQDEQTGGHWPAIVDDLSNSADLHASMTNGNHGESLTPANLQRWFEFLDFYVAKRLPEVPALIRVGAPEVLISQFGPGDYEIPEDRFTDATSYEEALAEYQAEDDVRVMFENGNTDQPGVAGPSFDETYEAWPPPEVEPTTFWMQPDGSLGDEASDAAEDDEGAATEWAYSQAEGQTTDIPDGGYSFSSEQPHDWQQVEDGAAASYLSEPLEDDVVMAGPASADLWITSTAEDTDLEVTITEVYPDGNEVLVQSGWLRASQRALDEDESTDLRPVQTHREEDVQPLVPGEPELVRVEVFPFGHVFREGSQIRVLVDSPGGNRQIWTFDSLEGDGVTNEVLQSAEHPSSIVLPVIPGEHDVPDRVPQCPGLRAQPCRTYEG
jgi:predicted acyl esterase